MIIVISDKYVDHFYNQSIDLLVNEFPRAITDIFKLIQNPKNRQLLSYMTKENAADLHI